MLRLRAQRGSVLVLTLLVVTFSVVIVGGFLLGSGRVKLMAAREYQGMTAYYAAESGLKTVINNPVPYVPTLKALAASVPDVYSTSDEQPITNEVDVWEYDGEGNPVQVIGTYAVTATKTPGEGMFLFKSYGRTPHGESLASLEVQLEFSPWFASGACAEFGSSVGMGWTVPGNAGDGQGNKEDIAWLFENGDVFVHGPLTVTSPNRGADTIFIDPLGCYFNTTDTPEEWAAKNYEWLFGRQQEWTPGLFPNPCDEIREALMMLVPAGSAPVYMDQTKTTVLSDSVHGVFTGKINPNTDIRGFGTLELNDTKNNQDFIEIDEIFLTGDMILLPNKPLVIHEVIQAELDEGVKPEGHRFILISDHSVKLGSGGDFDWDLDNPASGEYCPFPAGSASHLFTDGATKPYMQLGHQSVIWSAGNITITGTLRPYRQRLDTEYDETWEVMSGLTTGDPWDSLAIISKEGTLRFHHFKARGMIYSGGNITAYFLRLHGIAAIRRPLRIENETPTLGMANCHISYDENALDDLELFKVVVGTMVRHH